MSVRSLKKIFAASVIISVVSTVATATDRFMEAPFNYTTAPADNPVADLQKAIHSSEVTLEYDKQFGYLKSLLDALNIPAESQLLVFSKTSFQNQYIFPEKPRAIYFNDDVYIGSVQHGDVIEVSTADPNLGTVFYTLSQQKKSNPRFVRQDHNCLQCHGSTLTRGIPGHVMRSLYVDEKGFPILKAGTHLTTQASKFNDRWGGWYVTGTHGAARHMGNEIARELDWDAELDKESGANRTSVNGRVDTEKYLTAHSDIVSLMVLGHQTQIHNLITQARFETLYALEDQAVMDEILKRDPNTLSESSKRRIANAGEKLLTSLLFSDEVELSDPIAGSSGFSKVFQDAGPKDKHGRSLRELNLNTRLFTYPMSYLIYSPSFTGMPEEMKDYVYRRLWEILTDKETTCHPHISADQRQAIREILTDTLPDLPAYWHAN
jgi:hypothetical protein